MSDYYWKLKVQAGRKYDPSQPRVPAGDPRGGQWTSSGTGGSVSSLSSDQRFAWHQALNMKYYDDFEKLSHGGDLLDAMYNAAWSDSSAEDFAHRFERPVDAPEIPRPKKNGTDEERMIYGIASVIKEWGENASAVTLGKLRKASGLSERQLNEVYDAKYRGDRILGWETRADLNQMRIGSAWRFDAKRGIVHETEAILVALKAAGYSSPKALWKEMLELIP